MYFWQTTYSIISLNIRTAYWTPSLTRSYISSNNHNWFERAQFQIEVIEQIFNTISFFQSWIYPSTSQTSIWETTDFYSDEAVQVPELEGRVRRE